MNSQTQLYKDPPCPTATGHPLGTPPYPPEIPEPPKPDEATEPVPAAAIITPEMKAELEAYRQIYRVPGSTVIYLQLPPFLEGW